MTPDGGADNTLKAKAQMVVKANAFLKQLTGEMGEAAGKDFQKIPEAVARSEEFWGLLANWLCYTYKIPAGSVNAGEFLDEDTAVPTFSGLLNQAKARLTKGAVAEETKVRGARRAAACISVRANLCSTHLLPPANPSPANPPPAN